MKKISKRTTHAARRAIPANADPPAVLSTSTAAENRVRELEEQLRAMGAIGASMATTVGLDALFKELVPNISRLMRAERSTLFVYDEKTREIWSKVAQGHSLTEIRLELGHGIAGWAAEHRETINIKDAYADSRFNPEVDVLSGFKTRSVAAAPLIDRQGRLLGVLQVLNHEGGPFGENDIGLLNFLAVGTSYAVENANLTQEVLDRNRELEAATHRVERRRAELDLLYQLEQESAASSDLEATLSSIIARACERLRSKGGAVLLLQDQQATLFHLDLPGAEDRTRPLLHHSVVGPEAGVIGWVAKTGEPLISNALDEDPRYNPSGSDDPQVKAVLAVPLVWDHRVIGAVRVHTPSSRPGESHGGYDLEDLKVLTLIAGQVARGVSLAQARKEQLDTERLAAIGQMLAGVAHDLRNPMTVISGLAQIMADDPDGSARKRRCERILNQIDEMTAMIGDLLAFARGDRVLHPAIIDLGDVRPRSRGDFARPMRTARHRARHPGRERHDLRRCEPGQAHPLQPHEKRGGCLEPRRAAHRQPRGGRGRPAPAGRRHRSGDVERGASATFRSLLHGGQATWYRLGVGDREAFRRRSPRQDRGREHARPGHGVHRVSTPTQAGGERRPPPFDAPRRPSVPSWRA